MSQIPVAIRDAARARDGGCLRCGVGTHWLGLQLHHRKGRRIENPHTLSNIVTLCASCHQWVTEHPSDSYETGWQIMRLSDVDPADVPVLDLMGHWWLVGESLEPFPKEPR